MKSRFNYLLISYGRMISHAKFLEIDDRKNEYILKFYKYTQKLKKPRLKPESISLKAYLKVIETYLKNKKITERNACKRVFDVLEDNIFSEFQSFLVSFRGWCNLTENQKKYDSIRTFFDEKEKRKMKSKK